MDHLAGATEGYPVAGRLAALQQSNVTTSTGCLMDEPAGVPSRILRVGDGKIVLAVGNNLSTHRNNLRGDMKSKYTLEDIQKFVDCCKQKLPLATAEIRDEYFYASIPLCVVDAVFSISVKYTSTMRVVERTCQYFSIPQIDRNRHLNIQNQFSVSKFINAYTELGIERITTDVFQNRQRTSSTNGILKSDAVIRFCRVLSNFGVDNFGDISKILQNEDFVQKIKEIPGQNSGISLRYFYMLIGDDSYIKPDRMIDRFIKSAINKNLDLDDSQSLIMDSIHLLNKDFPQITPRLLDNLIWSYQRERGNDFSNGIRREINSLQVGQEKVTIRLDTDILDWFRLESEKKITQRSFCKFKSEVSRGGVIIQ